MNFIAELASARTLVEAKEYDAAFDIVDGILKIDPNYAPALIQAASIFDRARRLTQAYQFARRAVDVAPQLSASWTNYGRLSEELYQLNDAERAYKMAVQLSTKRPVLALNLNNLSSFYATTGRWELAEKTASDALAIDPGSHKARGNLGIAQLAQHKWRAGWPNYGAILGSEYRKLVKYRDEPEWDGTPGKVVVVTGEQGLGDELSFASMIPDAVKACKRVIVDCDARLTGLFKRSFSRAKVYGTRLDKDVQWDEEDTKPDYSISIGQLGTLFRNEESDFTGEPYLVPDKERHIMWREYFKTKQSPVIGIAWSGGLDWTGNRYRRWQLSQLQPLFDAVNAHWVSLQYKDAEAEIRSFDGADIHQYKMATLAKDYDETAGLVSACDLVICMQTSVGHLAASMGIPTWCFVNTIAPQWRYGTGDTLPWYKSMRLFRQREDGSWPIEEAARMLKVRFSVQPRIELARA